MTEMNGLYVDQNFRVQVIFMNYDETAWYLHGHDNEEVVPGEDSTRELTVEKETCNVTMVDKDGELKRGTYDEDSIHWEDSGKWMKVNISSTQWRMLTRRTYIPMTLILFSILQSMCKYTYDNCMYMVLQLKTKAKTL